MDKEASADIATDRARRILRALVEHYIRDGQPVGSRTLSRSKELQLSAASIRNVMADLEELGFIAAPHTSAGRIPTAQGYRFFVDTLVKFSPPGEREIDRLHHELEEEDLADSQALAARASSALSTLTSMAGVVTIPRPAATILKHVEFLPLSEGRVLAIFVVNDHEVQNRILHLDRSFAQDELQRSANYLNDNFIGQDIREIRTRLIDGLGETREQMNRMMLDMVSLAETALDWDDAKAGYVMAGQTKLMGFEELSDVDKLRQLFEAFSQQREILRLLDQSIEAEGVQIYIGEESGYQILDDCSIVAAPYGSEDAACGVLGVIGPTRMAYERVIPIVDLTARLVGAALKSAH